MDESTVRFFLLPSGNSPAVEVGPDNCFCLDPNFLESEGYKNLSTLFLTGARIWTDPIPKQHGGSPGACRVAKLQNIINPQLILLKLAEELCPSFHARNQELVQGTGDTHCPKRGHLCDKVWWSYSVAEEAALLAGPLEASLPLQLRYMTIHSLHSHALSRKKSNCFPRRKLCLSVWPQKPNLVGEDPQAVKILRNSSVGGFPWCYGAHC